MQINFQDIEKDFCQFSFMYENILRGFGLHSRCAENKQFASQFCCIIMFASSEMQVMCAKPCSNDYNKCIYILPIPNDFCLCTSWGYTYFKYSVNTFLNDSFFKGVIEC